MARPRIGIFGCCDVDRSAVPGEGARRTHPGRESLLDHVTAAPPPGLVLAQLGVDRLTQGNARGTTGCELAAGRQLEDRRHRAGDGVEPPLALGATPPVGLAPQNVGTSFLGAQFSESGAIPAQPMGAVSATQVLVAANGRIKVFDKAGVPGTLNTTAENFFDSVGGVANGVASVQVSYDRLSQRWLVAAISVGKPTPVCPNEILLAVSTGPVITDTTSFTMPIGSISSTSTFLPSALRPIRVISNSAPPPSTSTHCRCGPAGLSIR